MGIYIYSPFATANTFTRRVPPTPVNEFSNCACLASVRSTLRFAQVAEGGIEDGAAKRICQGLCTVRWSLDGRWLYIGLLGGGSHSDTYRTFVIPLRAGESFPKLPSAGITTEKDLTSLNRVKVVNDLIRPGPNGSLYAFSRKVPHRNIYRIPIP